MIGSNLLDAIPCNVKQKISQTATKAEYISDVGSKPGILKLLGNSAPYIEGLCSYRQVHWQASKSTNVNEKLAQIIVPCNSASA